MFAPVDSKFVINTVVAALGLDVSEEEGCNFGLVIVVTVVMLVNVAWSDDPEKEDWFDGLVSVCVVIDIEFGNDTVEAVVGPDVSKRDWYEGLIAVVVLVSLEICVGINNVVAVIILDIPEEEDW